MTPAQLQIQLHAAFAHYQAGRTGEAAALCARLRQPGQHVPVVWRLSGIVALHQGRAAEAEAFLRAALKLDPRLHEVWDNLGYALQAQGRVADAIACHEKAIALQPGFVDGWHNLGLALLFAGRPGDSLAAQERALALAPDLAPAHFGRALALQHCHRAADAIAAYEAALAREPRHLGARSYRLLALNYLSSLTRAELFAEHERFGAALGPVRPRTFANPRRPERRLRVAFLSPDLRTHSVAYFLQPILRHLDAAEFEVFLYHDHFVVDQTSSQLRTLAATWRNFSGLPADTVERQILADAPDLLVDLAGHTGLNRLPLLARRLAPVQIAYLGYPNTTGVRAVD
ncbi:MAG: tetratricopeptide repeat protein, partial [Opitutae bacterium]|nr:tetratricopeptide repeat protein [Opitutae bacterium]